MKKKLPCNNCTNKNFMVLEESFSPVGPLAIVEKVSVLIMYLGLTD